MMFSDRTPGLVIGVQPMPHQRLHNKPRIAKMPCAILLEVRPELSVEPVRPLLCFRLAYPFGLIPRSSCCRHGRYLYSELYVMQVYKKVLREISSRLSMLIENDLRNLLKKLPYNNVMFLWTIK